MYKSPHYANMSQRLFYFLLIFHVAFVMSENPSVIIIGAGPSGIAAASTLLQHSITNITILEAENRIGGRIQTVDFAGGFLDLGAEYCHGEEGNAVYELVKDFDVLQHTRLFDVKKEKLYTSDGTVVESDVALDLKSTIATYDDDIDLEAGNLGDAFMEKYNSTILEKYKSDAKKLKVVTDAIKFLHDIILMHEAAFDWHSPAAGRHYTPCQGDQMMTWKSYGYKLVLDVLMNSYPNPEDKLPIDDKIFLNKTVNKIIWNSNGVTVKSSDDSSYSADHVIFTPSIGVLSTNKDTLFEPELPEKKQTAISAMGFDAIMKIYLNFPERWWKDEDTVFLFLWKNEDLANITDEFPDGPTKDGISWVSFITSVVKVPHSPNVLNVWFSGDLLPEIENISDDIIMKGCMYVIRKFLGKDYNITEPDQILKSQWYGNPNFRGTFSYEKAGYFEQDISYQANLGEPLTNDEGNPVVLFAGEATNPIHYSTIHGAIEAGRREAERIVDLHKKVKM